MASDVSFDEHVSKAVRHYSSLFTIPSYKKIVLGLSVLCILGGILAILPLHLSYEGFILGLIFGGFVLYVTISSDFIIHYCCVKRDPILNMKRCAALSLFSCFVWFGFIVFGSALTIFLGNTGIWIKLFLLGFCAMLICRFFVFSISSFATRRTVFLSSLMQPTLYAVPVLFMGLTTEYGLERLLFFLALSVLIAVMAVRLFTVFLNRVGQRILGISSVPVVKALIATWVGNSNVPLERIFEKLGTERNVRVSLMIFRTDKKIKSIMVVPKVHPGPFKNVGSSLLPYLIQNELERKLQCTVSVPHGLCRHELDLCSQVQNKKVVEGIFNSIDSSVFSSNTAPFVRVDKNTASASCQIFGDCALLTLTMAPKTTEDLPEGLDMSIINEAEKRGILCAIVVDAHNSINKSFNLDKAIGSLKEAAVASMQEAASRDRFPFEIGTAKVIPKEFGVKEGMGPGGISVIVTRVGDQKVAYVTIDGNNMVSGLREKILSSLREVGILDGEVLTTDTHAVSGIVLTERGYHPIGEMIDHAKLIYYIKQATIDALNNIEPAEVSWRTEVISNVKVIGEKQMKALCLFAEEIAVQAKKLTISLFCAAGVLLASLLTFL